MKTYNLKKIISLICISALVVIFYIPAYASSGVTLTVSDVTAQPGEDVQVPVILSGNSTGILGMQLSVSYNSNLTLKNVTKGEALPSLTFTAPGDLSTNPCTVLIDGLNADVSNGTVLIFTFTAPEVAGKFDIQIPHSGGEIYDNDTNKINVTIINGSVEVVSSGNTGSGGAGGGGGGGVANKPDNDSKEDVKESMEEITEDNSEKEVDSTVKLLTFTDIKEDDWYYDAVKFAYEKGITSGTSETSFSPNDKVTRGQFITMLCRAYNIPEMSGDNFNDAGNTWYTGYLAAAKQLGISNGVGEGRFEPQKNITREEMVTLIYNYLKSVGEIGVTGTSADFRDENLISDWANESVAYAYSKGIVSGKENNIFDPKGNATRAELAQIFFNMLK